MENKVINYNKQNKLFKFCHETLGIDDLPKYLQGIYNSGMSCNEMAEMFYTKYGINVTPKGIEYYLKADYIYNSFGKRVPGPNFRMRTASEAKEMAMDSGRMIYKKKPEIEKYKSKPICANTRMKLLQEAEFKCSLCGNGRHNGYSLEIHHKDFNEKNNEYNNYQVLCYLCHRGVHSVKKEGEASVG